MLTGGGTHNELPPCGVFPILGELTLNAADGIDLSFGDLERCLRNPKNVANVEVGEHPVNYQRVGMDFVINLENAGGGRGVYLIGGFKNWTIRVDDPGVADVDELGEMLAIEVAPKFES